MRSNDVGLVLIVLGIGFLLGVFSTLTVYSTVMGRRVDEERAQADRKLEEATRELDETKVKIADFIEHEKRLRDVIDQGGVGGGDDTARAARPAPAPEPPAKDADKDDKKDADKGNKTKKDADKGGKTKKDADKLDTAGFRPPVVPGPKKTQDRPDKPR